jgi:hypothetical protein
LGLTPGATPLPPAKAGCGQVNAFDEDDRAGLERICRLFRDSKVDRNVGWDRTHRTTGCHFCVWRERTRLRDRCKGTAGVAESNGIEGLYHEIAGWPRERQREHLGGLPAETRAELWTFHLRRMRDEHPEFTAEQRAVLDGWLALMGAPFFSVSSPPPEAAELKIRAHAAFPPSMIYAIFYIFGPG